MLAGVATVAFLIDEAVRLSSRGAVGYSFLAAALAAAMLLAGLPHS